MNNVVLFLPETGIYPYLRTLCVIGKIFSDNIYLLHCTGQLPICNMVSCTNIKSYDDEKKLACSKCQQLYYSAKDAYSVHGIELNEILSDDKIRKLESLIPDDLEEMLNFTYNEIPIGKLSQCDLVLKTKYLQIKNITTQHIVLFKKIILNALISVELSNFLYFSLNPDRILAFNPYTMNQVCAYYVAKNNVSFNYIANNSFMGADYSAFMITKKIDTIEIFDSLFFFLDCKKYPILPDFVQKSWKDSFFRFYGSDGHIFSNAKNKTPYQIISTLGLSKDKKTVIAFTSSNDEMIGIVKMYEVWNRPFPIKHVFKTQIEWIEFLKKYADSHKDIQIIVRVHPREGKRQNGIPSEHLLLLQEHFKGGDHTDNFVIIWADDPISSYDLIELADLCLVNWSTMGQECARVGIPVLTYTSGSYYVNSKSFTVAESVKDYEVKLTEMLKKPYSIDMLTDAIRYNFWRTFIAAVDCSDTVPHDFKDETCWPRLSPEKAELVKKICTGQLDIVEYNKNKWLSQLNENSEKEEIDQIYRGVSDFYYRVFYRKTRSRITMVLLKIIRKLVYLVSFKKINFDIDPKTKSEDKIKSMIYSERLSKFKSVITGRPYYKLEDGCMIIYLFKGRIYTRYSPLLYKLGMLYKNR